MQTKAAQNTIESFINYIDDGGFTPAHIKGMKTDKDLSSYRRCIPWSTLLEIDPYGEKEFVFPDATLSMVNDAPFAVIRLENDLPQYSSLQRVRRLPPSISLQRGKYYKFSSSGTCGFFGYKGDANQLVNFTHYLCERDGKYHLLHDSDIMNNNEGTEENLAHGLSGMALAYSYFATMEIEQANKTSVALPLNLPQLREVLRDRDKPESGSRRPALLHLVRSHKRRLQDGDEIRIKESLRGKISCHWRGWDITLRPSLFDSNRLRKPCES